MLKIRRSRLESYFDTEQLDAILFTSIPNIRYLCGFTGSDGALVISRSGYSWFLCDSRYTSQALQEVIEAEVREYPVKLDGIASLVEETGFFRIGFESAHTTVSSHQALEKKLARSCLIPLAARTDEIRSRKDTDELAFLQDVCSIASESFLAVLGEIKPGLRESEFALLLEIEMRKRGADKSGFSFIVASGERGALPHGRASDRTFGRGEFVTIDFGAVKNGYHSDETVTVSLGTPDDRLLTVYCLVHEAQQKAIDAVKPGMTCKELDEVARSVIIRGGYGEYFGHGLGHGIGLEVHEKPVVSPRSETIIEEGMVFTVEPGVYLPGAGGIRIEDTIAVTADGCRVLTKVPKDLILL